MNGSALWFAQGSWPPDNPVGYPDRWYDPLPLTNGVTFARQAKMVAAVLGGQHGVASYALSVEEVL